MIPGIDQMLAGQGLDFGKIHHHAVGRVAVVADDVAGKRNLDRIAVTVQMPTLTLVVRYAVAGVEFEAAGDQHRKGTGKGRPIITPPLPAPAAAGPGNRGVIRDPSRPPEVNAQIP
ncbi:MAG: hypothetical protein AW09_004567 [Candidatus Accumulibacter phosphatis]|uniref:Uncharacterized protein n=1 Tax=Candidatus Accumulibacter phosphatis TaxID=327160 RepID=A0A084Y6J7_9PROT|nr:MAG: hypothetical protein AW09_004567 [Candidatus Accumulibacter phosphatis]